MEKSQAAEPIKLAIDEHDRQMREWRNRHVLSFPQPRLERRHLEGARLLPTRYDMLDELPKGGVVCEIGVANGDFSAEILKRNQPKKLHLVDAWVADRYHDDRKIVESRFAAEIDAGRVNLHVGYSTDRLPEFPDHYFDWVYIDSVHDYKTTAAELAISLAKVKPGGIIAGHDYTPGNIVGPVPYGVIQAVQEFCVRNDWRYICLTCESHCYVSFALQAM